MHICTSTESIITDSKGEEDFKDYFQLIFKQTISLSSCYCTLKKYVYKDVKMCCSAFKHCKNSELICDKEKDYSEEK